MCKSCYAKEGKRKILESLLIRNKNMGCERRKKLGMTFFSPFIFLVVYEWLFSAPPRFKKKKKFRAPPGAPPHGYPALMFTTHCDGLYTLFCIFYFTFWFFRLWWACIINLYSIWKIWAECNEKWKNRSQKHHFPTSGFCSLIPIIKIWKCILWVFCQTLESFSKNEIRKNVKMKVSVKMRAS